MKLYCTKVHNTMNSAVQLPLSTPAIKANPYSQPQHTHKKCRVLKNHENVWDNAKLIKCHLLVKSEIFHKHHRCILKKKQTFHTGQEKDQLGLHTRTYPYSSNY